jgi:hypothetical protein
MSNKHHSNESGIALLTVLLAMGLITAIGAALTAVGIVEYRASANHRSATRALMLADAGATHALALLHGDMATHSYTDVLLGEDGAADTDDDGLFVGFELGSGDELPDTGVMLGGGRYFVRMVNDDADPSGDEHTDDNHRFVALCRGETPDGGVAEVRVMLAAPTFPAIATNGDLYLPGTPDVVGPCGGVHANRILMIDGHPTVSGSISASQEVIMSGVVYDPFGAELTPKWAPPIEIPEYDPLDFCDEAEYVLAGGKLFVVGPPEQEYPITGPKKLGWKFDPSTNTYTLSAGDAVPGTVCAHGNIRVTGNLGSPGNPLKITLLATGSIHVGGTPVIEADLIEANDSEGVLIMAGGDVQIGGTSSSYTPYYKGLVYAGSQCQVNGTPVVEGHILCFDAGDPIGSINLMDDNKVNGTPQISYDCSGVRRRTLVAAWWESRTS